MWIVTWRADGEKVKVSKEFETEEKARAFYLKRARSGKVEVLAIDERQVWELLRLNRRNKWVVEHTLDTLKAAQTLYFKLVLGKDKYKVRSR